MAYASDSNRLTSLNGATLQTDASGNQTRLNSLRYAYDDQGRLSEVYEANLYKIADYKYNALGQRISKRVYDAGSQLLQGTTAYLYDPSGKLIGQTFYDESGVKTSGQYWFWLDNLPLAQLTANFSSMGEVSSSKLIYLHSDQLNTPRLATDSTQTLLWSWNSDAYGVGLPNEDADGDGKATSVALRFPGQIYDGQSRLNYNYFRDYNTQTGRYAQSDPIGLTGGLNTYAYVEGNPLKYIDPKGLSVFVAPGAEAGAAVGTFVCPGVGTVVGGFVGAGIGSGLSWYFADKLFSESSYDDGLQPSDEDLIKIKERDGNKAAQDAGFIDAHDAKEGRGGGAVNIYHDKKTGKKWLWNGAPGAEKEAL